MRAPAGASRRSSPGWTRARRGCARRSSSARRAAHWWSSAPVSSRPSARGSRSCGSASWSPGSRPAAPSSDRAGRMADRRLGRLETLGAWLGVWTPPRGAEVPPVPWRAVAAVAVLLVVAVGAAVALLAPGVRGNREQAAERERVAAEQRHARALATADREQRPRTGRGPADPGAGAPPARRARARTTLLAAAQEALQVDAATRRAGRTRGIDCE